MALQSLILPILSVFRSAGLQQASGALRSLTGNFTSLAGQIGLAAGSFASFSALSTAREFTTQAVQATSLFERNLLALNQVFEELQPRLISFTKEVESYGLSQSQAAQASVFLGSVLKQYGFSVNESAGQTERLVTLAQDLATTYGYDVQEALLAITALFRGEYDPIEKFGVAMKQNEVNARLAAQGLDDLEGAELANAQATARLEMLFERAGDSVGAFARATDTLYASQQRLNAVLGNLQIAAGAPLQKPLAEINNIFAQIFEETGPGIAQIFESLGQFIDILAPILGELTETVLNLIMPLQQVINLIVGVLGPAFAILQPILVTLNSLLGSMNAMLDAGSAVLATFEHNFRIMVQRMEDNEVFGFYLDFFGWLLGNTNPIAAGLNMLTDAFEQLTGAARAAIGEFDAYNGGARAASSAARRAGYEARDAKDLFKELDAALRAAATGALDAEGKLDGLAGAFQRVDDAKALANAKQGLEDLGFSAGMIEEILTRPNWKEIFGLIEEYARLAATEVKKVFVPLVGFIEFGSEAFVKAKQAELAKKINDLFKSSGTTGGKKAAKDVVKDFFDNMKDEIQKQTVREQLKLKGASDGLVDAILGSDAWMKLWQQIKRGTLSLEELQKQFNNTAAGIREQNEAYDEAKRKQEEYDEAVRRINERLQAELERIREKADAAKLAVSDMLEGFVILPTLEREIGRFESQITQMLSSIESSLRSAFRNEDILEDGYKSLQDFARRELSTLQDLGRQRDEFAKRYDLAAGLIDNYKKAFTAAANLTSLFGSLKDETEKRAVTVVSSGIIRLGATLREFGVTVTKSYEEPIAAIQNKTEQLVSGFRDIATRARSFAENLRKLRELGLDPMLFDQLVQAGVVAGGETAQALVDGGAATIDEINMLFAEIDAIGAGLGEQVATSLYGSGINMMDGLLAGIRSKQEELENTARTLAEAFNKEFQSKFNIQVGIAQTAAEKAATDKAASDILALGPEPVAPPNPALATLDALIANANKFIDTTKNATNAMGAIAKREIFEDLRSAIAGGAAIDISGIQAKMSSADIVAAVKPQAPNIVNNAFYIQPGNRANQNATVESLKQFINQNGNLVGYGIQ